MERYFDLIMAIVENPSYREPDRKPGRERYFGRGGPYGWIRVVTEFAGDEDHLVTVFPQRSAPSQARQQ